MNTQKQIFLIVVLFFTLVGGCAAYSFIDPVRADRQEGYFDGESIRRGALLYANNCRTCHGNEGQGGVGLQLNKDEFRDQDPLVLEANRDMLRRTLFCGRAGTQMPPWLNENGGALKAIQIDHIINFLTAPVTNVDENGNPEELPNTGWEEAEEFAYNLNFGSTASVSGDSLDSIASQHNLGGPELAALLGVDQNAILPQGTLVDTFPAPLEGIEPYEVESATGMTPTQVADTVHLGAAMLADLNGITYEFDGDNLVVLEDGEPVTGLMIATQLQLPGGAVYDIVADDTLQLAADKHGLSPDDLLDANDQLDIDDPETVLEARNTLQLPNGTSYIVVGDTTLAAIADAHLVGESTGELLADIDPADLASANEIEDPEAPVAAGTEIQLPDDTHILVTEGMTVQSLDGLYSIPAADIASENGIENAEVPLPLSVELTLPEGTGYVVQGQSFSDVAGGLTGATGFIDGFAEANEISDQEAPLRVGQVLHYSDDVWGTAPSGVLTSPDVCVQHAVPNTVYEGLLPGAEEEAVAAPETVSEEVVIEAHANDWTIVADGEAQPANEGVAAVLTGTEVLIQNVEGVHTMDLNDEQEIDMTEWQAAPEHTFTFGTAGQFSVTCEIHPDMFATIFVVDAEADLADFAADSAE